jgi:hypothetical protein
VHGKITFEGAMPEMKELPRFTADGKPKDANCPTKEKANYLTGSDGGVADVVVRLPVGAVKGQAPADPYVLDQKNCLYSPHVIAAVEGGKLAVKNSDPTMHNIHPFLPDGEWFNQAQQPKDPDIVKPIEASAGDVIKLKCDAHPWMLSWVVVNDNPHAAVTGADGSFKIEKVPAGTYKLQAWHPHMGVKEVEVKVEADKDVEVKFPAFTPADYKEPT